MLRIAVTVCVLVSMSGCGTIIHGREQEISFNTNPPGAKVRYDGGVRGETPCVVHLKRRPFKNIVVLEKDGYESLQLTVRNSVSLWALLGNVVIGGIPGWIIDAATGSFGACYTDSFSVDLVPLDPATQPAP